MADNLTTQSTTPATVAAAVPIATKQLADLSHAGVAVIIDPADRTKMLKPAADGSLAVTGPATDAQMRATALPVSLASVPLPAGASTAANQATSNTSVASIDTKTPALGQALAAAAVPVVLTAIQQTALTPPAAITGFALEAGHLSAIDTATARIPAQGQALAAASTPVVLTAIQQTALTPPAAITGFALEAGHLATIDTSTAKIPSQGQALAAASTPVVLTAIQQAALTPPTNTGYATDTNITTQTGALTEAAPATDTASSGLNGRLQRMAQRITSLIAQLPAALGSGGGLKVDGSGTPLPVSGTVTASIGVKATLWQAAPASRGTGLTTELNSLANGAFSAVGTAIDNTANKDQYAAMDIVLASLTPASGATLSLYLVQSADGTTYEDAPSATNPGSHMLVATVLVTTGAAAKRIVSPWFYLPPGKFKLVLLNSTGVALGATLNTVTVYTSNDQAQ